jgi:hypothetical protein
VDLAASRGSGFVFPRPTGEQPNRLKFTSRLNSSNCCLGLFQSPALTLGSLIFCRGLTSQPNLHHSSIFCQAWGDGGARARRLSVRGLPDFYSMGSVEYRMTSAHVCCMRLCACTSSQKLDGLTSWAFTSAASCLALAACAAASASAAAHSAAILSVVALSAAAISASAFASAAPDASHGSLPPVPYSPPPRQLPSQSSPRPPLLSPPPPPLRPPPSQPAAVPSPLPSLLPPPRCQHFRCSCASPSRPSHGASAAALVGLGSALRASTAKQGQRWG